MLPGSSLLGGLGGPCDKLGDRAKEGKSGLNFGVSVMLFAYC